MLPKFKSDVDMYRASVGCLIVGAIVQLILMTATIEAGSALSALAQLNNFLALGMLLGVTYEIRRSGGRRSMNIPTWLIGVFLFLGNGIHSYSKSGMFAPFAGWIVAAAAQRYKVSLLQIATLGLSFVFISYYLVPYCQIGRSSMVEGTSLSQSVQTNIAYLSRLPELHKLYEANQFDAALNTRQSETLSFLYYDRPHGLMDRLQMIGPDDSIIDAAESGGTFGILPTIMNFENLIPHFIWKGKPTISFGNVYAHEIGLITNDDDKTTGISFSASGDLYYQAKWVGILVMLPCLALMFFFIGDSVCGDPRESPLGLLAVFTALHSAPEGMSGVFLSMSTIMIAQIYFVGWTSVYLLPRLAEIFMGRGKQQSNWNLRGNVPTPGRFATVQSEEDRPAPAVLPPVYRWSGRSS
ncbi:hypothetical protein [Granulicella arctica]|uniref:Oligosaccharide repeat unit polymerase n=1 Tax=Granulicella arctica TaxID=940613 RepID=A0A7Y9PHG9_9BACT|nr:hypothetical protein [Granulicella arctica]NYF79266.1 hypothetical protein [Granulicella arctica]